MNGSKVDRNCSYSKIDRQIKDNAYQALREAEHLVNETHAAQSAIGSLVALIEELSIFSFLDSSHYDATLDGYIKMLKARRFAAMSKVRIRRVY